VTLYVYPEEEVEEIDIAKEWKDIKEIDQKVSETDKKITNYLKELKIDDV